MEKIEVENVQLKRDIDEQRTMTAIVHEHRNTSTMFDDDDDDERDLEVCIEEIIFIDILMLDNNRCRTADRDSIATRVRLCTHVNECNT